jgi:predicted metal-binding membrane protein
MISERTAQPALTGASALLFTASAALTIAWCHSMAAMGGMPMPGGWTMSMAWMRMPGQTWAGATVAFTGMWLAMMVAMMLPSLAPMLARYRASLAASNDALRNRLTLLAGAGYFFVWILFGLAVFPIGAAAAAMEMNHPSLARAVPAAAALAILFAGALQFSRWKAHALACCREMPMSGGVLPAHAGAAWRQGLRFGLHCCRSCANLTVILLALGVMDLRAMALVTAAISAERLAPPGERVARGIGAIVVVAGFVFVARAATAA